MRLILALLVALGFATVAQADGTSSLGTTFCALVQDGESAVDLNSLLTPSLAQHIAQAQAKNDAIQAAAPDEKPPLGDGIPWMSWQDRPDTCTAAATTTAGDKAEMTIEYRFSDSPESNYSDTLLLAKDGDGWLIDDIRYSDGQTLRTVLQTAFEL